MKGIEIEVPDREEAACALDTVEARLVRQGQYDAACDVINAKRRIRLDEEEIAALEAQLAQYRWRRVEEEMPEPGVYVIAHYRNSHGNVRRIRAMYAARYTLEQSPDAEMGGAEDYDETTDTYYVVPGWYECNEHEEVNWRVDEGEVSHWMPLPPAPEKGE